MERKGIGEIKEGAVGITSAPVAECLVSIYEQILPETNFSVSIHRYRIGIAL